MLRRLLLVSMVGVLARGELEPAVADAPRPNVVLILADDKGWADPGFHGGNAELTPHMDRQLVA